MKILFSWIGSADREASQNKLVKGKYGPLLQALKEIKFDKVYLLSNWSDTEQYIKWLKNNTTSDISFQIVKLSDPTDHEEIWKIVPGYVDSAIKALDKQANIEAYFHLSSGTASMHAVWILVSRTYYPAKLIQTSVERGLTEENIPFNIIAEYYPNYYKKYDKDLERFATEPSPLAVSFNEIRYQSLGMAKVVRQAQKYAPRNYPILIEGESGTGKELLAKAIHSASLRKGNMQIINCGAIPENLLESELFGYEKGAFTGAHKLKKGILELADKGTLFLDEIGDLPKPMQMKLLRCLEDGHVRRIGGTEDIDVDMRLITATNKNLETEVMKGYFREDLFYRIAVGRLTLPPLREREGDMILLINHCVKLINDENKNQPGYKEKKLRVDAKNILLRHSWPGNVRELLNTIRRAFMNSDSDYITGDDIRACISKSANQDKTDILGRPFHEGFNIEDVISEVHQHYMRRALRESGGNKTKAAKLLGITSYQVLSNWMDKYNVQ